VKSESALVASSQHGISILRALTSSDVPVLIQEICDGPSRTVDPSLTTSCDDDQLAPTKARPDGRRRSAREEKEGFTIQPTFDGERSRSSELLEVHLKTELLQRRARSVGDRLPRCGDEPMRVEKEPQRRRGSTQITRLDDPRELRKTLRQVGDPPSGGEASTSVPAPGQGDGALRKV
jgi:hypothetical protein